MIGLLAPAVVMAGAGALYYMTRIEPYRFRVVRRDVVLRGLPERFDPMTILHISDLHLYRPNPRMVAFLRELADLETDLVLATGDLIINNSMIDYCADALRPLRGRLGTFAVFGNHDHYDYSFLDSYLFRKKTNVRNDSARLTAALARAGVRVLNNRNVSIPEEGGGTIHVAGVDDHGTSKSDLRTALDGIPPGAFTILLSHTIDILHELKSLPAALIVAGHTHGGQIRIPRLGPIFSRIKLPNRFCWGVGEFQDTTLAVTSGLGVNRWGPFRLFCPPEAVIYRVRRGDPSPMDDAPESAGGHLQD
ncbi:metallophosphoesterase [Thermodesulfobacteriota bacterium]